MATQQTASPKCWILWPVVPAWKIARSTSTDGPCTNIATLRALAFRHDDFTPPPKAQQAAEKQTDAPVHRELCFSSPLKPNSTAEHFQTLEPTVFDRVNAMQPISPRRRDSPAQFISPLPLAQA
jgi:hypothetical protein